MGLAQAVSASGTVVSTAHTTTGSNLPGMPKGGLLPANSNSMWSKRASRGYQKTWVERGRNARDPLGRGGTQPETWADAEVEIVDERDRCQGQTSTTEDTDRKAAGATGSSKGEAATDKEAAKRRLSELHRLLNSRKESLNETYRRNAEANDKAYDHNQKSVLALDAMAKEYVDFEVTMANVTHVQEAGDSLHVATLEVAEELERTLKEQSRLQEDQDSSSDVLTAATKEFADCWAAHEATGVKLRHGFREVSNRRAVHDELSVAEKQALQRTLEGKRKDTELQEDVAIQR